MQAMFVHHSKFECLDVRFGSLASFWTIWAAEPAVSKIAAGNGSQGV
jgi:hypothetical protein